MEVIYKGTPQEIAALVSAIQERQEKKDNFSSFSPEDYVRQLLRNPPELKFSLSPQH